MSKAQRVGEEWAEGWVRRARVVAELETLRDCVTCASDAEARREHIEHLIRIYTVSDDAE